MKITTNPGGFNSIVRKVFSGNDFVKIQNQVLMNKENTLLIGTILFRPIFGSV